MKYTSWQEQEAVSLTIDHLKYVLVHSRAWHRREQSNHKMHPAIRTALDSYRPDRLHLLVLEWGHRSHSDPSRIAYTQSDEKGIKDIQTVTSVGKYLKRHFTHMPDHVIRDIAALYAGHSYEIVRTMPEILDVLREAPTSCMNNCNWDDRDWARHPYNVYDPAFGWGLAYSKMGNKVTGRCLVNDNDKIFVRSYNDGESFSHSNEGIEMWLRENGYSKASDWVGCRIARIEHKGQFIAPYLDGDNKYVTDCGDYFDVCEEEDATYQCESQGGYAQPYNQCTCDSCGTGMGDEDGTHVGYHGDVYVCESCLEDYIYAIGRGGNEYYVHQNDTVYVETHDQHYDDGYLDQNGIVYSDTDMEHYHRDDCVYLDNRSDWVHQDSDEYVYCESSGNHEHRDDCVRLHDDDFCLKDDATQCASSLKWYADADDIEWAYDANGDTIHPDEVIQMIIEEEGEGE
jgi:hypothetical protein